MLSLLSLFSSHFPPSYFVPLFAFRFFNAEQLYLQDSIRLLLVISPATPELILQVVSMRWCASDVKRCFCLQQELM